ncbi:MAG: hypothetical protein DRP54_08530 [Spirochaetes bacterium]|nr:MAG: hypothetical protein DRP54_08530 [Spirochaetota bacterium]
MSITICTVLAIMKDNKILLIRREKEPFKGMWALPGGKLEHSEHVEDCALRECKEETGLNARFDRICGIVNEHILSNGLVENHFLLHVCKLEPEHENYIEGNEGELRWFTVEEIFNMHEKIVPSDLHMIKDIIIENKGYVFKSVMERIRDNYIQSAFEPI